MVNKLTAFVLFTGIVILGILTALESRPEPLPEFKKWEVVYSYSSTGHTLNWIWGTDANDIWAYGPSDRMFHWDGTSWTEVNIPIATISIESMWGSSSDDIWAIGQPDRDEGEILHWDGSVWSKVSTTSNPYPGTDYLAYPLLGIWGNNSNDIWIVGDFGKIIHWNGNNWTIVQSNTDKSLFEVWGFSNNNVWAVGDGGCVMHWNGSSWSDIQSNTSERLGGIWGSATNDFWVCGNTGILLHLDGSNFSLTDVSPYHFTSLWGIGNNDIWGTGFEVYHWDGNEWSKINVPPGQGPNSSRGLEKIWACDADNVWGVAGRNIFRYQ